MCLDKWYTMIYSLLPKKAFLLFFTSTVLYASNRQLSTVKPSRQPMSNARLGDLNLTQTNPSPYELDALRAFNPVFI